MSLAFIHWPIILFMYSAFIWVDWRWVLIGVLIYWVQIAVFKACIISIAQYKNTETSFVGANLNNLFRILSLKELSMKKIRLFLDWILPIIFLFLAYYLQNNLGVKPLLEYSF
jgi:hypothetical protein